MKKIKKITSKLSAKNYILFSEKEKFFVDKKFYHKVNLNDYLVVNDNEIVNYLTKEEFNQKMNQNEKT